MSEVGFGPSTSWFVGTCFSPPSNMTCLHPQDFFTYYRLFNKNKYDIITLDDIGSLKIRHNDSIALAFILDKIKTSINKLGKFKTTNYMQSN